jgi:hypothetical protein
LGSRLRQVIEGRVKDLSKDVQAHISGYELDGYIRDGDIEGFTYFAALIPASSKAKSSAAAPSSREAP